MKERKNGASVISFDKVIFLFGGNNQDVGSLDCIERYAIEFDKWTLLQVRLREPVHDTLAFNLGGGRVLIFGGSANGVQNQRYEVVELSGECKPEEEVGFESAKIYLPPVFDGRRVHLFSGYCDSELKHETIEVRDLLCSCRAVDFRGGLLHPLKH